MRFVHRFMVPMILVAGLAAAPAPGRNAADAGPLTAEVRATEVAFARTMADRDFAGFAKFIAPDAVFIDDPVLRGREAVLAGWKSLYEGEKAPFSWAPEAIDVLPSGGLAMSHGPVYNAKGEKVSTFWSVWRRGRDGHWQIVLDHGCRACACTGAAAAPPPAPLAAPAAQ